MSLYVNNDTIYALATAPGKAGIAVIRLSGPKTIEICEKLTKKEIPKPHYARIRSFYHPKTSDLLDNGLLLFMPNPHSFTGEDVAECQIHGGPAITAAFLEALSHFEQTRLAEPGEFSRRAFLNGKLDLTEIEALADLIHAQTQMQHRLALRQMAGSLTTLYQKWREDLKKSLAYLEAFLDFPDEDLPESINPVLYENVQRLKAELAAHLNDQQIGEKIREGFYVSITGLPNAGKSTLLNYLAKRDVAIVTDIAGTTRDPVEVEMNIGGYPVVLIDTAGLQETTDIVESIGIKKALEKAEHADFNILLLEGKNLQDLQKDLAQLNKFLPFESERLLVINKSDLLSKSDIQIIRTSLSQNQQPIFISLKDGQGIDDFKDALLAFFSSHFALPEGPLITRERHRVHLQKCLIALESFLINPDQVLAAEDLRQAMHQLGTITGIVDVEDLLDVIFRDFCIGK